jgi:hypothetical protein
MGSFIDLRRIDEQDLARAMAERIRVGSSYAEALRELRAAFPDSPLAVRVAALAMLARHTTTDPSRLHIPR